MKTKEAQSQPSCSFAVSGRFISDANKLSKDIIKYFPKFFDDFTNFEYNTGANAGQDFKRIFNKAKKVHNYLKITGNCSCDHQGTTIAWGPDNDKCTKCELTWDV